MGRRDLNPRGCSFPASLPSTEHTISLFHVLTNYRRKMLLATCIYHRLWLGP